VTLVQVFDPAMCCSTGVCGPAVDPRLVRFAADLDWLKSQGASVERFNLAQEPRAFAENAAVKAALEATGEAALPLVEVDGEVKSRGVYPSRDELALWAGVEAPAPSLFTDQVAELVAIGAAIASNCEPCFKFHSAAARKLGVSREDMASAVTMAQRVKDTPAQSILTLADRILKNGADSDEAKAEPEAPKAAGSCCGGTQTESKAEAKAGGCC
jgi:AhpD family alkylhydroperoxidase